MQRFWPLITIVSMLLISSAVSLPTVKAADCEYVLGFQTLHDLIPGIVGECTMNEHYNANGDAQQETTNGMMVWRKSDNFTAFTDGSHTWVNGPQGVQMRLNTERFAWESDHALVSVASAAQTGPATAASAPSDLAAPASGVSADEATTPADTTDSQPLPGMAACTGNYHYVSDALNGGEVILLDDGSAWEIAHSDVIYTMIWLPGDAIVLDRSGTPDYPCYMANESDGESANGRPAQ